MEGKASNCLLTVNDIENKRSFEGSGEGILVGVF
jgi:hypothetical protein